MTAPLDNAFSLPESKPASRGANPFVPPTIPGRPLSRPEPVKPVPGSSGDAGTGPCPRGELDTDLEPQKTIKKIDHRGHIIECKMESGVMVKIKDHGHVKKHAELAIMRTVMETVRIEPYTPEELSKMTYIEAAAKNLARRGALGDGDDVDRLLDRVMGRPKQSSETVNVNLTLDDILTASDNQDAEPADSDVIELTPEPDSAE